MFENVPQAEPVPVVPPAAGAAPVGITAAKPITQAIDPVSMSQHQAEQEMVALFKRASLSTVQKIILVVVTVLVLSSIIGLGVWLYVTLQPFSQTSNDTTNTTQALGNTDLTSNSNVNSQDTDGDGLTDNAEQTIYHTNPLKADTDGDGYSDGQEVQSGHNPLQK